MKNRYLISALLAASALSAAHAAVDTGRLAIKTPDGFYVELPAPELRSQADVIAKAKSLGGVPVHVYNQLQVDEPRASAGFQSRGNNFSRNPQHTLSRSEIAWQAGFGVRDISVAVLDTPFPEFHPSVAAAYDKANAYDMRNNDAQPWMTAEDANPAKGSPFVHGIEVAGVVVADFKKLDFPDNAAGIAPGVSLMPINVCCYVNPQGVEQRETADDLAISNGIRYAAGLSNSSGRLPTRKADVIVLAYDIFGGGTATEFSRVIGDAITDAVNAGVLFVTGSGNGGSGARAHENAVSRLPGVIVVSGTELSTGHIADFSTSGTAVDVSAEFEAITPTVRYSNGNLVYTAGNPAGTSYSTPYVAGLYALAKSVYPALTPAVFSQWLEADRLTFPNDYLKGRNRDTGEYVTRTDARDTDFGFGIIDAKRVLDVALAAAGKAPLPAVPKIIPTVTFEQQADAKAFNVTVKAANPYLAGIPLGNLAFELDWTPGDSATALKQGGVSRFTVDGANTCTGSTGTGFEKTDSAIDQPGLGLLADGGTCTYRFTWFTNGYSGNFTLGVKTASVFSKSDTVTNTWKVGAATPPTISSFLASPATIQQGASTTLSWTSANASSCSIGGTTVPASGSLTVTPASSQSYALNCTGTGGATSRSTDVSVTPAPGTPPTPPTSGGSSGGGGGGSFGLLTGLLLIPALMRRKAASRAQ